MLISGVQTRPHGLEFGCKGLQKWPIWIIHDVDRMQDHVVEDSPSPGSPRSNLGVIHVLENRGEENDIWFQVNYQTKLPFGQPCFYCLQPTTSFFHLSSQTSPTSLSFEAMADEMDVDQPKTKGKKEAKDSSKARFEVKKVMRILIFGRWGTSISAWFTDYSSH